MLRCDHCLLEFPAREAVRDLVGNAQRVFCCAGCRGIYRLIADEGLSSFYDGRRWDEPGLPAPAGAEVDAAAFGQAVRGAGSEREVDLYIDGIRCASCVWLNEKLLQRMPGVRYARVNYATHRARIRWEEGPASLTAVLGRIRAAGYLPKPYSETERIVAQRAEARDLLVRLGTAGFLSSQLMIYSIALYAGYFQGIDAGLRRQLEAVALGLTLPVLLYSGAPFLRGTLRGLRHLRFDMDALIVLGSGAALLYSVWQMLRGGEVYFDTAAMIVTLILIGRYVEVAARGKASEAVTRLSQLLPRQARLVTAGQGGEERRRVPVAQLSRGDLVEVVPGERVPLDGRLVQGTSEVDESILTGESRPVAKAPGAEVAGGTLNLHGSFVFQVTRTGQETVLSGIIRAVEEAQLAKPRIQALADQVVGAFVPAVLLLASATVAFHLWRGAAPRQALMIGISVVVIACPCSLGLATPIAVLLATGLASARGLLLKGGDVLERASRVTDVLLDKTGTVTRGRPQLRQVVLLDPASSRVEALALAAAVEQRSEHHLGRAVVEAARLLPGGRERAVSGFRAVPGKGVVAGVDGELVTVGSRVLLAEAEVAVPEEAERLARPFEEQGDTVAWLARGGRLLALLAISDLLRDEALQVVEALRRLGLAVAVVSGDNGVTTGAIAARLGVEAEAEASPLAKREKVSDLQRAGRRVLMVGDGINDAPALTQALVGVAVARGTDVTLESADAVLVRDDLRLLPDLVRLSRRTHRIIRQNVFWALFYNAVAIPLAMAGALHPIVAAGAMAASSLFVVGNSLRVRGAV
jgi:P-type Cu2+ transporter